MEIIEGVRGHLLGQSRIVELVVARVFSPRLPEKLVLPAVQLQLIDEIDRHHLRGPQNHPYSRVQLDAWAFTLDEAVHLGRLCRARLNGFAGTWQDESSPTKSLIVQGVFMVDASERFDEDIHGGLCVHSTDYRIRYTDPDLEVLI